MTHPIRQSGYTLIELLIVITLSSLLLISAVAIFFTTLQGGGKTAATEYTKQSGQYAITQISYLIRNAKRLQTSSCQSNMTELSLLGQDNEVTTLRAGTAPDNNRIASVSASTTRFLTPSDLEFAASGGLVFDCAPASFGTSTWDGRPPTIRVRFTLQKGSTSTDLARDIVAIPFETSVTLRNF